ncbi:MAG: S1/P1 nuclease [Terriglobia bacterium]|jgi:hypothetical protein
MAYLAVILATPQGAFAWGREGHQIIVIVAEHFIGDLHQPLHDEDNGDKGGNTRHVIFDGHPHNLYWVWDAGLLQQSPSDS